LAILVIGLWGPVLGAELTLVDEELTPDLFVWTDTCNVYVLRDGDAALLIDLGDGSVLDRLEDIGVKRVEWVLFTHHHREQCQGAPRLNMAQVACNQAGWDPTTRYFHPGGSFIINRTGEVTAVIPSNLIFERLRPELAVGVITPRNKETKE
jgi:glyoxylase-like metal-dependent hydrolase (beta-lactamase superfamily II)